MNLSIPADYRTLHFTERKAVREEYVRLQNGACYYCKEPLTGPPSGEVAAKVVKRHLFPATFFRWPVHLHHSHDTGMTIGAVHCHCNAVLWQYHDE